MVLFLGLLVLATPILALRSFHLEGSQLESAQYYEPLTLAITVENKRQVMDRYLTSWFGGFGDMMLPDATFTDAVAKQLVTALPPKLQEMGIGVTVQKNGIDGLTAILSVTILPIEDIQAVIQNAMARKFGETEAQEQSKSKAQEFAAALVSLEPILDRLELPEKFEEIKEKIGKKVHQSLAELLPTMLQEKLAEMGVVVKVSLYHAEPAAETEPSAVALPAGRELIFWINLDSRDAIAREAGSELKSFAVTHMSNKKFLSLLRTKLEEKVPQAVSEKIGEALQLSFETKDDIDAGDPSQRTGFWAFVKLDDMNIDELLKKAKGEDFVDAFKALLGTLNRMHELGVEQMGTIVQRIHSAIDEKVLGNIKAKISEQLAEIGHVRSVEKNEFAALMEFTANWPGRCCNTRDAEADGVYWVSKDLLKGPGVFGRSGRCPAVDAAKLCASVGQLGGTLMHKELTKSHFMPAIACFEGNFLDFGLNVPVIVKKC